MTRGWLRGPTLRIGRTTYLGSGRCLDWRAELDHWPRATSARRRTSSFASKARAGQLLSCGRTNPAGRPAGRTERPHPRGLRADRRGRPTSSAARLTPAAYQHGMALALPSGCYGAPDRCRARVSNLQDPDRGSGRVARGGAAAGVSADSGRICRPRHGPRGRRRGGRPRRRIGEGGRPPTRPVALDGQAPSRKRPVQGGRDDHGAARLDLGAPAARPVARR